MTERSGTMPSSLRHVTTSTEHTANGKSCGQDCSLDEWFSELDKFAQGRYSEAFGSYLKATDPLR